jgi:beta-lactamase regulating signal transducer with metallopeptidase domain
MGALRAKSVSLRLAVWTAVLYAALAMPLLGMILPPLTFEFPSAVARIIPQRVTAVNTPRQTGKGLEAGALAAGTTPAAPFLVQRDILSLRSNSDVGLARAPKTARSNSPSVDHAITPDAAPWIRESKPVPMIGGEAGKNRDPIPWIAIFAVAYISVTLLFLARLFLGIILSRRLLRASRPIQEPEATRLLDLHAREEGLAVPPRLAESELISVPITLGILRPVILLPVEWREWNSAALHAVIAHELSHVIRRDALTQRLSLLHRAVFWFSPLSWWLHRCLADAAEEASDEAALLSGADRAQYAETLLGFFVALQESPQRVNWQGVSMAKAGQAEKRVDRILAWKGEVSMRLNKSLTISLLLLGISVVLFAAAARPSVARAQDQTVGPAPVLAPAKPAASDAAPSAPSAPEPTPAPVPAPPAPAPPEPPPPAAFAPQVVPAPPISVQLEDEMNDEQQILPQEVDNAVSRVEQLPALDEVQKTLKLQLKQFQQDGKFQMQISNSLGQMRVRGPYGDFMLVPGNDRYVIVSGDSPIFMSGDPQDVEHATSLRSKISGNFIWFQRNEKTYVIRDQAAVNRAKEFFKLEEDLSQKQEALGKQQQALGDQQKALGEKMEAVRVQIPDMSADMQKLEAEIKQLSAGGTQQQLGDLQRQMGDLQRKFGELQFQAGGQQRQIGDQMRDLGQQQGDLGRQQGDLGRQQAEASRQASDQMKQLLDDAITRGTAQPE